MLEWTEVDPGFDDLFALESVGDGRVMARVWTDGDGQGLFGQRIAFSSDGIDWTEAPMPEGLFAEQVNISADRWVVTGRYPDVDRYDIGGDRVFFSDDQGSTWTEMVIDLPTDPVSPYVVESWRAPPVLVSGQRTVLVLMGYPTLDGQALLEDLGRLPAGKRVVFTLPTPDGVSFTLVDSDYPDPYAFYGSLPLQLAAVYGHFDQDEFPESTYEELELTYDEAGLTEADMPDLFDPRYQPSIRILAADGATTEVVASYEGFALLGAATSGGFIVTAFSDGAETVLRSADGLAWSEDPLLDPGFVGGAVSADGTIWGLSFENGGSFDIQRAGAGEMPVTVATFDGLQHPGRPVLGPAGLVVVAQRDPSRSLRADRGLPAEGRLIRDGYELRYNETDASLTLWDLAGDTAIYVFGPEDMRSATPPDGIRVIDDGPGAGVIFEDPETGADLVTFTEDDMAFLVGMAAGESQAASSDDPDWPDLWVGWSAEGTGWGWQSLAETFGIHDAQVWAEFAVGHDFVIARVAAFQPPDPADPTGSGQRLPARWFLARVP